MVVLINKVWPREFLSVKKPLKWSTEYYKASLELQALGVEFSPFIGVKSWNITSGSINATISDLKNLEGTISSQLTYSGESFSASATSNQLTGFGMNISNLDLTARFSKFFSFESLTGGFSVKHPEFDALVHVNEFEFLPTGLEKINLGGEFHYKEYDVKVQSSTFNKKDKVLEASASVVSGTGKEKSILNVESFKIHTDGQVEMGAISGDFDSGNLFGPLRITMEIPKSPGKDDEGYNIYKDIKGSFLLNLDAENKQVEELAISEALVSFKRHPETGKYKDVKVTWQGDISVGKVGFVNARIKKITLEVDEEGMLSGIITCDALLEENVSLKAYLAENEASDLDLILHKDLEGQVEFHFSGGSDFKGDWKLNKLTNMNGDLKKGGNTIATFRNGHLNESQTLTGKLSAVTNASYKNRHCRVNITDMDMGFAVSLQEGIKSFKITEGRGAILLSEMENVTGQLQLDLEYIQGTHFAAQISQSKKSEITAFSMQLSNLALNPIFDTQFNLISISGSVLANHPKLDSKKGIYIKHFEIKEGRLTSFEGNGAAQYKGFQFDLGNIHYENTSDNQFLKADALVVMKLGKSPQKIEVNKFQINAKGEISVGEVIGEFKKGNTFSLDFKAAFNEDRLAGSFDGKLGPMELGGAIDMGSAKNLGDETYHFGFLSITSSLGPAGVPLGPTGLKLTKIGGRAGINYYLPDLKSTTGDPREGNYVAGLTTGISDVGNVFNVEGNTMVNINEDNFQLDLTGKMTIPKKPPYVVQGDLEVTYRYPEQTLNGNANMTVMIPPSSGFLLKATPTLVFNFQKQYWMLKGNNSGQLFNAINFTGLIELKDSSGFRAHLNGIIDYSKEIRIEKGATLFGFGLKADAMIGISCYTKASLRFTDDDLASAFRMNVTGKGDLEVSGSVEYNWSALASGTVDVEYKDRQAKIKGELLIQVINGTDEEKEYKYEVDTEL